MFEEEITKSLTGLPKRLKAARLARGFTSRYGFAAACGVGLPTYLNHETGRNYSLSAVMLYSKVLEVSLDWLVLGEGHPLKYFRADDPQVKRFLANLDVFLQKDQKKDKVSDTP